MMPYQPTRHHGLTVSIFIIMTTLDLTKVETSDSKFETNKYVTHVTMLATASFSSTQ
jgi:hypothetical protein